MLNQTHCSINSIVRYHTSWVETDHQSQSFDLDSEATRTTQATETDDEAEAPTDTGTDGSSNSDGVSDFEEDDAVPPLFEMDMDLGLEDLNNIDFLSVGHAKSVSFPRIHFGLEEDDPSTHENTPIDSKRSTRASSPAVQLANNASRSVRTLYIQMEYVEKLTLKEAIDEGVSELDCWRLMFQILSAMLHFTSLKFVEWYFFARHVIINSSL